MRQLSHIAPFVISIDDIDDRSRKIQYKTERLYHKCDKELKKSEQELQ